MPKRQPSPVPNDSLFQPREEKLPTPLRKRLCWTAVTINHKIAVAKGDLDNITCRLCQQIFTTPRRLKVHMLNVS